MRIRTLCLMAVVALLGCRDEQAGPHRRSQPARPQSSSAGRVLSKLDQPLTFRSGARLGDGAIVYVGARVEPASARPGTQVRIVNYFVAMKAPPQGWQFFMHVVDASTGQMVLNADHPIQQGALPLENWPEGKLVEDVTTITLPQGLQSPVRVLLGFWKGDQRLDVAPAQAQDGTNRTLGPLIPIEGGPLPEYHAHKTAHPPAIDGKLDDPAWKQATAVDLKTSFDGGAT